MKKSIFFLLFFALGLAGRLAAQFVQAPIVVQSGADAKMAATLDEALNLAVNGDVIYLPGGSFSLSSPINKRVEIFGTGWRSDSASAVGISSINSNLVLNAGATGGSINSVDITGDVSVGQSQAVTSYLISRCKIGNFAVNSSIDCHLSIKSSLMNNVSLAKGSAKFSNCVIFGKALGNTENNQLMEFKYCVFSGDPYFDQLGRLQIYNSIIHDPVYYTFKDVGAVVNDVYSDNLWLIYGYNNTLYFPNWDATSNNTMKDFTYTLNVFKSFVPGFSISNTYETKDDCSECPMKGVYAGPTPFPSQPNKNYLQVPVNPYITAREVKNDPDSNFLKPIITVQPGSGN